MTTAAVLACLPSLSARPQVVSLILLAVTVRAWISTADDLRLRWWLIPVTWFWATAHGYWTIGVLVGMSVSLALRIDQRVDGRGLARLLTIPTLSIVAACLTPVGPSLLATQFAVSARSGLITEWAPTSFHEVPAMIAGTMILLPLLLAARSAERSTWVTLSLVLLAAALTAYAVRMVALGAIISAPLVTRSLQVATSRRQVNVRKTETFGVLTAALVGVFALGMLVPFSAKDPANVPDDFTRQLAHLPPGSAVMLDSMAGSWIEWRFPHLNPMLDGMFDAYSLSYLEEYESALKLEPGWQSFIKRSGANYALLSRNGAMAEAMKDQLGWRVLSTDARWVLLVTPEGVKPKSETS